ncbi:MAG: hypothetical protein J6I73_08895 [Treponema sp.]|nr:hypothetical protein [Treponema sp.]
MRKLFLGMIGTLIFLGVLSCTNSTIDSAKNASTTADVVAGEYYTDESYSVAGVEGKNAGVKLVIKKTADDTVSITIPGFSYSSSMTINTFDITNVVVSTVDNENYVFALGEFTSRAVFKEAGKDVKDISVSGTFKKSTKTLTVKAVYTYGAMPLPITNSFSNTFKSTYQLSDIMKKYYTFEANNNSHLLKLLSSSESVYIITDTEKSKITALYFTYAWKEIGTNVYLLTSYVHANQNATADTTGASTRVDKITIKSEKEILVDTVSAFLSEYTITANLSCFVNAMGGIDFGAGQDEGHPSLLVDASVAIATDGSVMLTANFRKSSVIVYGQLAHTFIDSTNSIPGYYISEEEKKDAIYYTTSADTATDRNGKEVHYVDAMSFPVSKDISSYNLWIYVNSNTTGLQFCNGKGEGTVNQPNVATSYVGKITLNWDTLSKK